MKVILMILVSEGWNGQKSIEAVTKGMIDGVMGRLGKNSRYSPV
jgi:hypothetical protein